MLDTSAPTMSFCRRRRPHLSSIQISQVEVEGTTLLCFPTDHSWFQGNINTDDESSYSIIGERIIKDGDADTDTQADNNNKESLSYAYKVTLTDHFTGLSYQLPQIEVNLSPDSPSLLRCTQDAQITFKVEHIYKGQKADMEIQRYGGNSALLGQNCLVYSGPISLVFKDSADTGRTWCL